MLFFASGKKWLTTLKQSRTFWHLLRLTKHEMQPKKIEEQRIFLLVLLNSKDSLFSKCKQKQKNDYYCILFMKWTVKFDDDPFLTIFCALCPFVEIKISSIVPFFRKTR